MWSKGWISLPLLKLVLLKNQYNGIEIFFVALTQCIFLSSSLIISSITSFLSFIVHEDTRCTWIDSSILLVFVYSKGQLAVVRYLFLGRRERS